MIAGTDPPRKPRCSAAGVIFKRARGQGRITAIAGLTEFHDRHRAHIVEDTLFRPGTPRRDRRATLLSDGYLGVRHPDWDQAPQMAFAAATDVQLYASQRFRAGRRRSRVCSRRGCTWRGAMMDRSPPGPRSALLQSALLTRDNLGHVSRCLRRCGDPSAS